MPNNTNATTAPTVPSVPPRPPPQPPQPIPTHLPLRPPSPHLARQHPQPVLYPVASPGRGYTHRTTPTQPIDSAVAAANSAAAYATRGVLPYTPMHFSRQPVGSFQSTQPARVGPLPGLPKVASSSPTTDSSGHKNNRDKGKDDTVAVIRDRQVRISEGASLYSLCRSWMKNGSEESQPPPTDVIRTLPKPLPPLADKMEDEVEQAEQENEESVDHLSAKELLKRHVDRAKRVRAESREKRLNRIKRYRNRLRLLLPPLAEQQSSNNNSPSGNLTPGQD